MNSWSDPQANYFLHSLLHDSTRSNFTNVLIFFHPVNMCALFLFYAVLCNLCEGNVKNNYGRFNLHVSTMYSLEVPKGKCVHRCSQTHNSRVEKHMINNTEYYIWIHWKIWYVIAISMYIFVAFLLLNTIFCIQCIIYWKFYTFKWQILSC